MNNVDDDNGAVPTEELPDTPSKVQAYLSGLKASEGMARARIGRLEDEVERHEAKLDGLRTEVQNYATEAKVDRIENRGVINELQKTMQALPSTMATSVAATNAILEQRIEKRFGDMERRFDDRLSSLERKVDDAGRRISEHEALPGHKTTMVMIEEMRPAFSTIRAGRKWFFGAVAVAFASLFGGLVLWAAMALMRQAAQEVRSGRFEPPTQPTPVH